MSLGAVREPRRGPRHLDLAARRRREVSDVRHPLTPDVRIDRVLIGPTGIHVVTTVSAVPASAAVPLVDAALVSAGRTSAQLVASALPPRYRDRVRPVLCRIDEVALAETVDGVLLTSRGTLEHILASSPVVLSTSEINDVALRLDARLEPFPVAPPEARRRWRRRHTVVAGLVATASGAAVAALAQVAGALPVPW
jgi:hypothetical protein